MFFDNIIRKPNWNELEVAYKKLSDMYQDLYEEKQTEIELKEQQVSKLSSKVRQWMRRYHELEVSTREDSIDVSELDNQDQEYVQQLQDIVADLSKRNHRLEQRLSAQKVAQKNLDDMCEVIEITPSNAKVKHDEEALNAETKAKASKEKKEVDLKFSPKFQAILERHAQECNG